MKALHQAMMGIALLGVLVVSVGLIQPAMVSAWAQDGRGTVAERGDEAMVQHGHMATVQRGHHAAQHGQHAGMQHGDVTDPEAHFRTLAEHLGLTAEQQETLAEPFNEAFAAMQKLHELHEVIAAELTEEQRATFGQMAHEMMGSAFGVGDAGGTH